MNEPLASPVLTPAGCCLLALLPGIAVARLITSFGHADHEHSHASLNTGRANQSSL